MMEKCVKARIGQTVKYRFESAYPLEFNIHWHTDSETFYEVKEDSVENKTGSFLAKKDQHYCFTWINHAELGAEWIIPLAFTITDQ